MLQGVGEHTQDKMVEILDDPLRYKDRLVNMIQDFSSITRSGRVPMIHFTSS